MENTSLHDDTTAAHRRVIYIYMIGLLNIETLQYHIIQFV